MPIRSVRLWLFNWYLLEGWVIFPLVFRDAVCDIIDESKAVIGLAFVNLELNPKPVCTGPC